MTDPATTDGPWRAELDPRELDRAVALVRQAAEGADTVLLACHVGPDGDALGAMLALHLALSEAGAEPIPTVGEEPVAVPPGLRDLPGIDAIRAPSTLPAPDRVELLISVDAAGPDRLGSVTRYLDAGVPTVVIDHHASASAFGDVRVVAPRAAATVQLVAELLDRIGVGLTPQIATCLYAGLVTDTGRFGHPTTDASVMRLAARLLEAGVDHADLTRRLYDSRPLGELRLLGHALERLVYVPEVALVHTHVTREEVARAGVGIEATEGMIDIVRSAEDAEVAMTLKPDPEGGWRASLRSRGAVDVGVLASALGGGGHVAAAGFATADEPDAVAAEVVARLRTAGAAAG